LISPEEVKKPRHVRRDFLRYGLLVLATSHGI
jgi:hypothetical protein